MAKLPKQVRAFNRALERLVTVSNVATGIKWLSDCDPQTYSMPGEFGDLPHALLRRTDGGLDDEVWVHTEFELTQDVQAWVTLEFLAWWVRDNSRGGEQVQMRPMALPPVGPGGQVQLGVNLRLIIDLFVVCPGGDTAPALDKMAELADSLSSNIDDYQEVLADLVRE